MQNLQNPEISQVEAALGPRFANMGRHFNMGAKFGRELRPNQAAIKFGRKLHSENPENQPGTQNQ